MTQNNSLEMIKLAYKAMDDKKADAIKILDIAKLTPITDYFIICSCSNTSQMDAVIDNVQENLGRAGYTSFRMEGKHGSGWILLDYKDIVVHVFMREDRMFYDLERIWADATVVDAALLK